MFALLLLSSSHTLAVLGIVLAEWSQTYRCMQRRLSRALLRPEVQRAFGSRSTSLDGHGDGHSFITAGPLVQDGFDLQFSRSLAQRRSLFSRAVSRWQTSYAQATGDKSFSAAADLQLADTFSRRMPHSLEKALASQHPPTNILQACDCHPSLTSLLQHVGRDGACSDGPFTT